MFEQMAMSIGWNPYYKNTTKTIVWVALFTYCMSLLTVHLQEIHIIHRFENDFYDEPLRAVTLGYIRPEYDFKSLGKILWLNQDNRPVNRMQMRGYIVAADV